MEVSDIKKTEFKFFIFLIIALLIPSICKYFDTHIFKNFKIIDFFVFLGLLFFLLKRKNLKKFYNLENVLLIIFFIFLRISLIFSDGENHIKSFYEVSTYFSLFFLYFFFQTSYFLKNKKFLIQLFFTLFFTISLFESILGIEQFIFQKKVGFFFETNFGFDVKNSASIYMPNSYLKYLNFQTNYIIRSHGTFLHPNIYAGFLVISLFLTYFFQDLDLQTSPQKHFVNILLLVYLLLCVFALMIQLFLR